MLTTVAISLVVSSVASYTPPALTVSPVKTFSHIRATAVAVAPKGTLFAVASEDSQVRIIDTKTMETVFQLEGHPFTPKALAFSQDARYILSGDESARIWLWDVKTGKKIREFPREKGHTRGIQALTFAKDGKRFASVGQDDVIKVWDTSGGHPKFTVTGTGANFYGAEFLPSGGLVTATLKEGMRLYEPKAFQLAATLSVGGGEGANGVAINKGGTLGFTAGRDGRVVVWDIKKREKVGAIKAHSDWVYNVTVAPNGKVAASSSADTQVVIWDVKSLQPLASISGRAFVDSAVAITCDGKYVLTCDSGNALQIYQLDPPQLR